MTGNNNNDSLQLSSDIIARTLRSPGALTGALVMDYLGVGNNPALPGSQGTEGESV